MSPQETAHILRRLLDRHPDGDVARHINLTLSPAKPYQSNREETTAHRSLLRTLIDPANYGVEIAKTTRVLIETGDLPEQKHTSLISEQGGYSREAVEDLLSQGVKNWRNLDLQGVDLSGLDFRDCDFSHSILNNNTLTGSDFTKAIFHQAQLIGCIATHTIFTSADFSNANLEHIQAQDAHLNMCRVDHSNFDRAVLNGANLNSLHGQGWSIQGAELKNVSADYLNLGYCHAQNSNWTNASIRYAELREWEGAGMVIDGANCFRAEIGRIRDLDISNPNVNISGASLEQFLGDPDDEISQLESMLIELEDSHPSRKGGIYFFQSIDGDPNLSLSFTLFENTLRVFPSGSLRSNNAHNILTRQFADYANINTVRNALNANATEKNGDRWSRVAQIISECRMHVQRASKHPQNANVKRHIKAIFPLLQSQVPGLQTNEPCGLNGGKVRVYADPFSKGNPLVLVGSEAIPSKIEKLDRVDSKTSFTWHLTPAFNAKTQYNPRPIPLSDTEAKIVSAHLLQEKVPAHQVATSLDLN